eukprot:COSAG01_NODE_1941_length_8843_cov_33.836802_9_plen_148_part_00
MVPSVKNIALRAVSAAAAMRGRRGRAGLGLLNQGWVDTELDDEGESPAEGRGAGAVGAGAGGALSAPAHGGADALWPTLCDLRFGKLRDGVTACTSLLPWSFQSQRADRPSQPPSHRVVYRGGLLAGWDRLSPLDPCGWAAWRACAA